VNYKKRDILFFTITLANLTNFYSFYIILIVKKFYMQLKLNLSHHLIYVHTLPGKIKTYIFAAVHKT